MDDESRSALRRRRIGLIFQAFNLLPNLRAIDNVAMPLVIDGMPRSQARPQAGELLRKLGLEARAQHLPSRMSGGEQQRVAIARALIIKPAVIFADEPTGNLDSENSNAVMELLYGLTSDNGTTLIVVTHDPIVADKAQRQVHIVDGRVHHDSQIDHRDVAKE
jgi:putative ABC transport system ATP-binding protein